MINSFHGRATIHVEVTLEVLELAEDLYAYRRTESRTVTDRAGEVVIGGDLASITEGTLNGENLDKMRHDEPFETKGLMLFQPSLIEDLRRYGWHETLRGDAIKQKRTDVFSAFEAGEGMMGNLVRLDFQKFIMFDYMGQPRPVGLRFNYMNGYVDELHYNLHKAAQHLLTRSDVTILRKENVSAAYQEVTAARDAISPIPYYNAETGREQQIIFRWTPSDADYARLVAAIGSDRLGSTVSFYQCIYELDLLGLRAAAEIVCPPNHMRA